MMQTPWSVAALGCNLSSTGSKGSEVLTVILKEWSTTQFDEALGNISNAGAWKENRMLVLGMDKKNPQLNFLFTK